MCALMLLLAGDGLRLMVLVAVGGGLLMLGRWSSRLNRPSEDGRLSNSPTPDVEALIPADSPEAKVWPPSAEEVAASFPFDASLGKLRITKFFFKNADVSPGPPDPETFADELNIELYDPDTGHSWWQSYFVATPRGLAKILRDTSWRYLYAPDILVLPRYDLEEIRKAAVSRIVADHEYFKGKETEPQEESL
jgi:hypothetical protein